MVRRETMPAARDRAWLALLAVTYVLGLAVSWHRWGSPLIDTGREMNQPLRLASGEMLYSDVRHIYGPLSPWLHAALYRLFGPSLNVLYIDGIITGALILALVYWLARQIMAPLAAGAATLSIMWLCVFRPAGVYILPYSYNALHGTALGLITLVLLVAALKRQRQDRGEGQGEGQRQSGSVLAFVVAGLLAGLTTVAKTEMGVAAVAGGVTAGLLAAYPDVRRGLSFAAAFLGTAAAVTIAVYGAIAAVVGWHALVADSWLFVFNVPPELAYYNSRISGFDRPLKNVGRMIIAALKIGIIAALIGAISMLIGGIGRTRSSRRGGVTGPWGILAAAVALLIAMAVTTGLDWDKGPFLAMPFLLVAFLVFLRRRLRAEPAAPAAGDQDAALHTRILITFTISALASIARMVLHVRSGGAYGSFLLPMSVILFTYFWVHPFADFFDDPHIRRIARIVALTVIIVDVIVTAILVGYRYQSRETVTITTARGTMIDEPAIGVAWNDALAYIDQHTQPGDAVAVMPEGTSLDFLSGRRNPIREEIATPGYLHEADEPRVIEQLEQAHTRLILITNRPTTEFGATAFGRDYCIHLMHWIEAHYAPCAIFGPIKNPTLQVGDQPFFIRAWCATATPSHPAR